LPILARNYLKIAKSYENRVLDGEIPACEFVKAAIKRQRADLARWSGKDAPYFFDRVQGERICKFIECLEHTKGELAGQKVRLEAWQCWLLTTIFGWRRRLDGGRRFRRVYIEVPRGNGKSLLSSGVALYCLLADGEPGAEVYSFATTRDQAGIVFGDAKRMAQQSRDLRIHFGLEVLAHSLYVPATNSTFQAKSAEGSTLDGLNTHLAVVDELHAHKTRAVYDVVETSLGKRRNSLMWVITTAGFDTSGICYEVRTMVRKVLDGSVRDETQFGIIYGIDEGDDWRSLDALKKANPNWGVSVMPEMVTSLQKKAIALPSAANNFKTKHLDVWVSADTAWLDIDKWRALADPTIGDLSEFEQDECVLGLDLATRRDICAKVRLFRRYVDGVPHYFVTGDYFLPEETIGTAGNSQYSGWVDEGFLISTPGPTTSFGMVEDSIREDIERFRVQAVAYDPWQATQLANSLSDQGAPMVEVRQTVQNLSEPMKLLESLVLEGRIHHDGNPVLTWMMSNVVAHLDAKDNIFPRKERPENKIDGAVALIIALSRFVESEQNASFNNFVSTMAVI
jgi:phage terminase large subunit-like protein